MKEKLNTLYRNFGLPRLTIGAFFLMVTITSVILGIPFGGLMTDVVVRVFMNVVLVLAMVPAIQSGIGPNFGLPLGIICGLLGATISIELDMVGLSGFLGAIFISIPFAIVVGWGYGWLLNKVKGSEMMIATYVGFAAVSLMSIGWMLLPLNSPEMAWPMGKGVRTTISLADRFSNILNHFMRFTIGKGGIRMGASSDFPGLVVPTGLILFALLMCGIIWLVSRSKMGIAMKTVGDNPKFATASGLNVDKYRMIGTILSTVLGAVGIIVYAQSFGFLQLYQAPMFMGFAAVSGVLIGGANIRNATIAHVLIGTFLFQGLLVVTLPVANNILDLGSLAEITRLIVSNGIILYALTVKGGE